MGEGGFPPKTNKVLAVGGGGGVYIVEGDGNEEETVKKPPSTGELNGGRRDKNRLGFLHSALHSLLSIIFFCRTYSGS